MVIQRCWYCLLDVDRVVVEDVIEIVGTDARFDVRGDHLELIGGQLAGHPHFLNSFRCF